ncbi:MAG TPA: HAMP domain-containing sensor histidine kinase [Opitutales bacterium]|nr:HAMP domain-containing sensor histidine kinase [Opitutales bacterium]
MSDKGQISDRNTSPPELEQVLKQLTGGTLCPCNRALINFLENSPDPVLLFDGNPELIGRNERAVELWDGVENFIPPRLLKEVAKVESSGESFHEEKKDRLIAIEASNGRRYFLPTVFPLIDAPAEPENGKNESIIACVLKDETIWERSERIRRNLLSSISHELNTPLTSARLALYLLAEQQIGELNSNQQELVERAKQDRDREIVTIQNVLDMIRAEDDLSGTGDTEVFNLHELIEEAINDFESQIRGLALPITRDYASSSPQIEMERETAELVMHQLFVSILKYTGDDAELRIVTSSDDDECSVELTTINGDQEDFPPEDLFSVELASERARRLRCADLGLRVAHEMIAPLGGALSSERFAKSGKLRLRFPHASSITR